MNTCSTPAERPRIALLDASHTVETTRRNFRRVLDAELDEFHCPSGDLPCDFGYDGIVITGSSTSVYWDRDWIRELKRWVEKAVTAGLPALGICYGHQLLADVTGGHVEDMDEYEIGYRTVEHTGQGTLFDGIPGSMTVFTTHSDRVAALPPGGTVLAANDYGIQGFRKDQVYGVQFHPEYDLQTARMIAEGKDGQLAGARLQRVLDDIHVEHYEQARPVTSVFDNFLTDVQARTPQRAPMG
ncbi:MAG: GMP synthase [Bacteroidetes bacterium SW_9_63_38]|nr:MAG: GMP synthase [Bacteroidetes bacterium SW_9_63_38]